MGVSECKLRLVKESFLQSVINQESSLLRSFCAFISAFVYTEISVVYLEKRSFGRKACLCIRLIGVFFFYVKNIAQCTKKCFKKRVFTQIYKKEHVCAQHFILLKKTRRKNLYFLSIFDFFLPFCLPTPSPRKKRFLK